MEAAPKQTGRDWARDLITFYAEGYSDSEVASEMKITIREYNRQIVENPTFAKLVEFGRTLSLAWWESQARKNLNNKQFNTPLWVFNMKNKYGWADKVETRNEIENTHVNLDELRAKLSRETYEFIKQNTPELTDAQRVLRAIPASLEEGSSDD